MRWGKKPKLATSYSIKKRRARFCWIFFEGNSKPLQGEAKCQHLQPLTWPGEGKQDFVEFFSKKNIRLWASKTSGGEAKSQNLPPLS